MNEQRERLWEQTPWEPLTPAERVEARLGLETLYELFFFDTNSHDEESGAREDSS